MCLSVLVLGLNDVQFEQCVVSSDERNDDSVLYRVIIVSREVRVVLKSAIFSPDWFNVDSATHAYSYLDVVHGLLTNKNTANYI